MRPHLFAYAAVVFATVLLWHGTLVTAWHWHCSLCVGETDDVCDTGAVVFDVPMRLRVSVIDIDDDGLHQRHRPNLEVTHELQLAGIVPGVKVHETSRKPNFDVTNIAFNSTTSAWFIPLFVPLATTPPSVYASSDVDTTSLTEAPVQDSSLIRFTLTANFSVNPFRSFVDPKAAIRTVATTTDGVDISLPTAANLGKYGMRVRDTVFALPINMLRVWDITVAALSTETVPTPASLRTVLGTETPLTNPMHDDADDAAAAVTTEAAPTEFSVWPSPDTGLTFVQLYNASATRAADARAHTLLYTTDSFLTQSLLDLWPLLLLDATDTSVTFTSTGDADMTTRKEAATSAAASSMSTIGIRAVVALSARLLVSTTFGLVQVLPVSNTTFTELNDVLSASLHWTMALPVDGGVDVLAGPTHTSAFALQHQGIVLAGAHANATTPLRLWVSENATAAAPFTELVDVDGLTLSERYATAHAWSASTARVVALVTNAVLVPAYLALIDTTGDGTASSVSSSYTLYSFTASTRTWRTLFVLPTFVVVTTLAPTDTSTNTPSGVGGGVGRYDVSRTHRVFARPDVNSTDAYSASFAASPAYAFNSTFVRTSTDATTTSVTAHALTFTGMTLAPGLARDLFLFGSALLLSPDGGTSFFTLHVCSTTTGHAQQIEQVVLTAGVTGGSNGVYVFLTNDQQLWYGRTYMSEALQLLPARSPLASPSVYRRSVLFDASGRLFEVTLDTTAARPYAYRSVDLTRHLVPSLLERHVIATQHVCPYRSLSYRASNSLYYTRVTNVHVPVSSLDRASNAAASATYRFTEQGELLNVTQASGREAKEADVSVNSLLPQRVFLDYGDVYSFLVHLHPASHITEISDVALSAQISSTPSSAELTTQGSDATSSVSLSVRRVSLSASTTAPVVYNVTITDLKTKKLADSAPGHDLVIVDVRLTVRNATLACDRAHNVATTLMQHAHGVGGEASVTTGRSTQASSGGAASVSTLATAAETNKTAGMAARSIASATVESVSMSSPTHVYALASSTMRMSVYSGCPPYRRIDYDPVSSRDPTETCDGSDPTKPCASFALEYVPVFYLVDEVSGSASKLTGKFEFSVVGGGLAPDSMSPFDDAELKSFNQGVAAVWSVVDGDATDNRMLPGTPISWACTVGSPCAAIIPEIGDTPTYYFRVRATTRHVSENTYCDYSVEYTLRLHGLQMDYVTVLIIACITLLILLTVVMFMYLLKRRAYIGYQLKISAILRLFSARDVDGDVDKLDMALSSDADSFSDSYSDSDDSITQLNMSFDDSEDLTEDDADHASSASELSLDGYGSTNNLFDSGRGLDADLGGGGGLGSSMRQLRAGRDEAAGAGGRDQMDPRMRGQMMRDADAAGGDNSELRNRPRKSIFAFKARAIKRLDARNASDSSDDSDEGGGGGPSAAEVARSYSNSAAQAARQGPSRPAQSPF